MREKPTEDEIKNRIWKDIDFYNGALPERVALSWSGYLAALIEWGLISPKEHDSLSDILPSIQNNPAIHILLGREK